MKKPARPRHQRAFMQFAANGGAERVTLIEATERLIVQFVQMAQSDNPALRASGRVKIRAVAEACVAGQFFLSDQPAKARKKRDGVATIIGNLAGQRDELGAWVTAKSLWSQLYARLDEEGRDPRETVTGREDLEIEYVTKQGAVKKIKFASFKVALSKHRKS